MSISKKVSYTIKLDLPDLGVSVSKELDFDGMKRVYNTVSSLCTALSNEFQDYKSLRKTNKYSFISISEERVEQVFNYVQEHPNCLAKEIVHDLVINLKCVNAALGKLDNVGRIKKLRVGRTYQYITITTLKEEKAPKLDIVNGSSKQHLEESARHQRKDTKEKLEATK